MFLVNVKRVNSVVLHRQTCSGDRNNDLIKLQFPPAKQSVEVLCFLLLLRFQRRYLLTSLTTLVPASLMVGHSVSIDTFGSNPLDAQSAALSVAFRTCHLVRTSVSSYHTNSYFMFCRVQSAQVNIVGVVVSQLLAAVYTCKNMVYSMVALVDPISNITSTAV